MKILLLFSFFLVSPAIYAAPHPGMGSSALASYEKGFFWLREGFRLQTPESDWILDESESHENQVKFQSRPIAVPSSLRNNSGSLVIKVENLKQEQTLENYAKKWMKDYSNYGFEIRGSQTFALGSQKGLVIDFEHKKSFQQLRQVLFIRGKKFVLITCGDDQKKFSNLVEKCNQVIKSFAWMTEKNSLKIQ